MPATAIGHSGLLRKLGRPGRFLPGLNTGRPCSISCHSGAGGGGFLEQADPRLERPFRQPTLLFTLQRSIFRSRSEYAACSSSCQLPAIRLPST